MEIESSNYSNGACNICPSMRVILGSEWQFSSKSTQQNDLFDFFTSSTLQMLGESASRALGVLTIDFCFVKLGCYFLNVQGSSQVVDLVAYGGYKFVGFVSSSNTFLYFTNAVCRVVLALMAGFLGLPYALWSLVFLYAFLANAFFLVRVRMNTNYSH
jgi:hypothetical protein